MKFKRLKEVLNINKLKKLQEMAKIKSHLTVPQYIKKHMDGVIWDGFVGDRDDGSLCTKIAAYYDVERIRYYFVFDRGKYIKTGINPEGEDLMFRALFAHRRETMEWFYKEYSPSDLEQVKIIIDTHDDKAIEILELKKTENRNPLNVA